MIMIARPAQIALVARSVGPRSDCSGGSEPKSQYQVYGTQIFAAFFNTKPQGTDIGLTNSRSRFAWRPLVGYLQLRAGNMLSVRSAGHGPLPRGGKEVRPAGIVAKVWSASHLD